MKKILSGNEAVARGAFESAVKVATAYPGTPSTEILQNFAQYDGVYAEWSPNEKVALEAAVGASMTGVRTLTAMKHVGLNVAADPFMTLAYTGVKGGFLLVCADDPGMHSSQNEQDNRYYARFAQIPMLEPSDSQEAKDLVGVGLDLSEQYDTPAMLRLTTRISHSKGIVEFGEVQQKTPAGFSRDLKKLVMLPGHARLRHPLVLERVRKLQEYAETSPLNRIEWGDKKVGIIASGVAYQYVREVLPGASFLKLGLTYPLPRNLIRDFAAQVKTLLVVEELEPFLEEEIRLMGVTVAGKAFFSRLGELSPEGVAAGLTEAGVLAARADASRPPIAGASMPRPPLMCAGCSHRGLHYALKKLKGIVHSDIGCYTLACLPPLEAIETNLCMGASISMAHGTAKAIEKAGVDDRRPVFATIGDSTFYHSGITSLLDVVYNRANVNVIILDNRITAMTGAQDNPGTGRTLQGNDAPEVDLIGLVKSLGIRRVAVVDPYDLTETTRVLREEAAANEPSVIITKRPCMQLVKVDPAQAMQVDPASCIGCGVCLRLGCPAISRGEAIPTEADQKPRYRAVIDATVCAGCTLCAQVCKQAAVKRIRL